jgi:hypothetical protein
MFHYDANGGRLWVNVSDLWDKLNFSFAPWSGAAMFQNRRNRWQKLAKKFWLGEHAVRGSLPYAKHAEDPM